MKLATFLVPARTRPQAGEVRGDEIVAFDAGTVLDRLAERRPHARRRRRPTRSADVTLLAPIPRPPAIFCIGRNYAAHIAELGLREARRSRSCSSSCRSPASRPAAR